MVASFWVGRMVEEGSCSIDVSLLPSCIHLWFVFDFYPTHIPSFPSSSSSTTILSSLPSQHPTTLPHNRTPPTMSFSPTTPPFTPTTLILTLTLPLPLTYLLYHALSTLYLPPLSPIPSPTLYALIPLPLTLPSLTSHRAFSIHRLHQHYGPLIRIAPHELSFSDPALTKRIYGQAPPFMKSESYKHFQLATSRGFS